MSHNNKGQALVEFVIILPILLLIIMSIIDLGNIMSKKYSLENSADIIGQLYIENDNSGINTYIKENNININYIENENYVTIELKQDIKTSTPVLNLLLKNYQIGANKTVYIDDGDNNE